MTSELTSTASLRRFGLDANGLARRVASGELVRVRRGFYRPSGTRSDEAAHRLLVEATTPGLGDGAVLSHASAAVFHGLPVPRASLARVCVTRRRRGRGHVTSGVHDRGCPLSPDDTVVADGVLLTSVARTVVDLARTLPFDWGVAAADAALRAGLAPDALARQVADSRRWPGNARARAVAEFADARSESPGESRSRALLALAGVPAPALQLNVWSGDVLLGRSDFGWEEEGVLGEFDGMVKYGIRSRPGESATDALAREKAREDRLRRAGWIVVRWTWRELGTPDALARRVLTALEDGRAHQRR